MKPYVYLFCQNEGYDKAEEAFKPMLQFGGQVIHTANIGRESHGYLQHIIEHYNDLAQHTLFAQDVSNPELLGRMDVSFLYPSLRFLPQMIQQSSIMYIGPCLAVFQFLSFPIIVVAFCVIPICTGTGRRARVKTGHASVHSCVLPSKVLIWVDEERSSNAHNLDTT